MSIIGIDQSQKSTAITSLDQYCNLLDFELITPPMAMLDEELIHYQWTEIDNFLKRQERLTAIAIEGAAYNALGRNNDLLWGIQWYLRTRLKVEYPNEMVGILPVTLWRSVLLTREEQRYFKQLHGGKIGLKHGVVSKLPDHIKNSFDEYLEKHKDRINATKVKDWKPGCKSKKYQESLFDLSDSWGIAKYRVGLLPKSRLPKLIKRSS